MSDTYVIFIFRRDLRVYDNVAFNRMLNYCHEHGIKYFLPMYIFNVGEQLEASRNPYFCAKSVRFMIESLRDLECQLSSAYSETSSSYPTLTGVRVSSYKEEKEVLEELYRRGKERAELRAVFFNRDVTPFARARDGILIDWCKSREVYHDCPYGDYSLIDVSQMEKGYRYYNSYIRRTSQEEVKKPEIVACVSLEVHPNITEVIKLSDVVKISVQSSWNQYYSKHAGHGAGEASTVHGGRKTALQMLEHLQKTCIEDDCQLSAFIKYGCVSIREVYWCLNECRPEISPHHKEMLEHLHYRSFYDQMVYWWPHTLCRQLSPEVDNKKWYNKRCGKAPPQEEKEEAADHTKWARNEEGVFRVITLAQTGIPIVDASIRCLKETGLLSTKLKRVVTMTATRILKINWRRMEEWSATQQLDYNPPINRGEWERAVLHRRALNPWAQQKRIDPDCQFILKWVPELKAVTIKDIHHWYEAHKQNPGLYCIPIISKDLSNMQTCTNFSKF